MESEANMSTSVQVGVIHTGDVTTMIGDATTAALEHDSPADFIEFRIGSFVNFYFPPIITALGTVGNVLSFLVMVQPHNRRSSPSLYMAVLAVLDALMIVVGLFQYWCMFNFFPHLLSEAHCHAMFFFVNFVGNFAVWTIVAMTVERLIVVLFPLKAATLCNVKKTKMTLVSLCVASVAKNLHYIWTADFVYDVNSGAAQCAFGLVRQGTWVIAWQWIDTVMSSLLPFVIILVANICIIVSINRQTAKINRMSSSVSHANGDKAQARTDSQSITGMLVAVSLAFILLTLPLFILRTYFTFSPVSSAYETAQYHLGHHICHKLWYTNNAINFYIYSLTGSKFRRDLLALFCVTKSPSTPNRALTNSMSVTTVSGGNSQANGDRP